jgi:hypothetical protein
MTDQEAVLGVLRGSLESRRLTVSSDTRINGSEGVDHEEAEELIRDALRSVGLPAGAADHFPYEAYFYPEIGLAIGLPLLLARCVGLGKRMQRMLGLPGDIDGEKPPLTVGKFVDLILRIKAETQACP